MHGSWNNGDLGSQLQPHWWGCRCFMLWMVNVTNTENWQTILSTKVPPKLNALTYKHWPHFGKVFKLQDKRENISFCTMHICLSDSDNIHAHKHSLKHLPHKHILKHLPPTNTHSLKHLPQCSTNRSFPNKCNWLKILHVRGCVYCDWQTWSVLMFSSWS